MNGINKIAKWIVYHLPQRCIVFESVPDRSDNTEAVFREMIHRQLNKKYKFIWLTDSKNTALPKEKNVWYISGKIKSLFFLCTAKCIICCNRFFTTNNPRTVSIFLGHGNPIKNTKKIYSLPVEQYSYILATSEGMKDLRSRIFNIDKNKLVVLGYPRNDDLTNTTISINGLFETAYNKIIVWYPTYRQHKNGLETSCGHAFPIIWNQQLAKELNDYAKEKGVLIVLKPHFAQDVSFIKELSLSNLLFINDEFFNKHHISSYQFVANCDALLTDFSSIYYDYTLCDKPIGLIWEDYKEYIENPGFAVDMDYMMKGGYKIYNIEDLKGFINDIMNGFDKLKKERREIRDFANCSTDGRNAERVVDFLIKNAKL